MDRRNFESGVRKVILRTSGGLAGLVGALSVGGQAYATDGYFSTGYGTQSKGLAGAGLAYPKDTLAIATNPAAAFTLGDRIDVDADYFQARRAASITGNGFGSDASYSGDGGGPQPIPEFGLTHRVGDKWALGVAVYGNGGMLTDYKSNPFARF
jgi:long-chain fatty acid transport protein